MLLHLCRTKLGQTNAALNHQSKQPKIEEAKEMTPEEAEKNLEKLISYLIAEYGRMGKPRLSELTPLSDFRCRDNRGHI